MVNCLTFRAEQSREWSVGLSVPDVKHCPSLVATEKQQHFFLGSNAIGAKESIVSKISVSYR